jgi:tripartite-type tricarboxylate transporter receptor subunit TctC
MQMYWKRVVRGLRFAVVAAGIVFGTSATVAAESYPTRTVTIVVPFAPGSVTDAAARLIGQHLQEALGQPFVIENKTGAGGLIAASAVAHAAPDGYTLLITTNSTHSAAPALFKTVPYDPIQDFTPVARIGSFPSLIAVYPGLPIKTIGDLESF